MRTTTRTSTGSTANLKSIPTRYKGYHFRSRSEARMAVFLDALKVPWQYEHEGLYLKSGCYLPDFWLPDVQAWLEVKPVDCKHEEVAKWIEASQRTSHPLYVFNANWDRPVFGWVNDAGRFFNRRASDYKRCLHGSDDQMAAYYTLASLTCRIGGNCDDLWTAIDSAKSARFEHGESGAT